MKLKTISLLCLLCLATNSIQQENPCENAFTDRVKADPDSTVHSLALATASTTYTGTICNSEWSTYGTCCNKDKIVEVAEKRINDWKDRLTKFVTKVEEFA